MKILRTLIVVYALLIFPSYAFSSSPGWMRISLIEGDVQIKTPDSADWGPASINGPVTEGDQVWVPPGARIELQLNAGSYVRLDQESALQVLSLTEDSSQFYLSQGHAYVYYDSPGHSVIQVDTPDASTRAFEPAVFRIDISDRYRYTDLSVYKGYVEAENRLGLTRVDADGMLSLGEDTGGEVAPLGPPDEWERWNKERNDRLFAGQGQSSRYLPPELRIYSYDLDRDGRWVRVPEYGYCWTPTVIVGANWAPYRTGTWIWRGGEYVWVSHEPWGWAPYHYGRWTFLVNIGWCWVPPVAGQVYWGPGYVGWVRTGDYVAWVPLAPGEIYYGRGNYGPHSVNIINVNINTINVTTVYRNVYVNNGVTVVKRATFATASPGFVHLGKNLLERQLFTRKNISVGAPAIRPTRASYFASGKRIPAAKLPPQHVRNLKVTQFKRSRPLVKAPGKSVLNPGTRPNPLPRESVHTPRTPGKEKPMIRSIRPSERGMPGTAHPQRGPAPRKETPQLRPETKPAPPQHGPAPRKETPQLRPETKPAPPQRGPAPTEMKKHGKTKEKAAKDEKKEKNEEEPRK